MHPLVEGITKREIRSLARAISYVESNHEDKLEIMKEVYPMTGDAKYIGVTGSPGAGKSSMVNHLIRFLRDLGKTVAVVAVDPTSPFSGGAILGDRVRMTHHFTDTGVFIRSMGTRGSLGGLSRSTKETVRLIDAFGFNVILIETVGVGQSELDIMKLSDTTLVVLNPGSGDVVQVFKAGIMEIADLFVINKADKPGVSKLKAQINSLLDLVNHDPWRPPIASVIATENQGFEELWEKVEEHGVYLKTSGEGEKRKAQHFLDEVVDVVHEELRILIQEKLNEELKRLSTSFDPYTVAENFLKQNVSIDSIKGGRR